MSSVLCVLMPRFALAVAAGERRELLAEPVALAPEPGRVAVVGEVSPAAAASGVRPGLGVGEALARCPRLRLLPPDPLAVEERWEELLGRLEGTGAGIETHPPSMLARSARSAVGEAVPGTAWLGVKGIRRMHGGSLDGVVEAVQAALGRPARVGIGPSRFLARVAADRARTRRAVVVPDDVARALAILGDEPVAALRLVPELAALAEPLERLGVPTLGALAALDRGALGERFGRHGLAAHDLLAGREAPLRPRETAVRIEADLLLPEAASGGQLRQALGILIDRVLAHPARGGRPVRSVVVGATLVERGTWQERVVLREAITDAARMRLALGLRLDLLPAPAERLSLRIDGLGTAVPGDRPLFEEHDVVRRARLREAVRQVREVAGPEGALRVVEIDPGSRVDERRMALTPFEG